jgi:hypothetical protein
MLNEESRSSFSFPSSSLISEASESKSPIEHLPSGKIIESIVDNFVSSQADANLSYDHEVSFVHSPKAPPIPRSIKTPGNLDHRALIRSVGNIEELLNCFDHNESLLSVPLQPDEGLTEEEFGTRQIQRYHMSQVYHYLSLALQVKQIEMAERIQEYLWEHNNVN